MGKRTPKPKPKPKQKESSEVILKNTVESVFKATNIQFDRTISQIENIIKRLRDVYSEIKISVKEYRRLCEKEKREFEGALDKNKEYISKSPETLENFVNLIAGITEEKDNIFNYVKEKIKTIDKLAEINKMIQDRLIKDIEEKVVEFTKKNPEHIKAKPEDVLAMAFAYVSKRIMATSSEIDEIIIQFKRTQSKFNRLISSPAYTSESLCDAVIKKEAHRRSLVIHENVEKVFSSQEREVKELEARLKDKKINVIDFESLQKIIESYKIKLNNIDVATIDDVINYFTEMQIVELDEEDYVSHRSFFGQSIDDFKNILKAYMLNKVNFFEKMTKIFESYKQTNDIEVFIKKYKDAFNDQKKCLSLKKDLCQIKIFEDANNQQFLGPIFYNTIIGFEVKYFEDQYYNLLQDRIDIEKVHITSFLEQLSKDYIVKESNDKIKSLMNDKIKSLMKEMDDLNKTDVESQLKMLKDIKSRAENIKLEIKARIKDMAKRESDDMSHLDSGSSDGADDQSMRQIPEIDLKLVSKADEDFISFLKQSIDNLQSLKGSDYMNICSKVTKVLNNLGWELSKHDSKTAGSHCQIKATKDFGGIIGKKSVILPMWDRLKDNDLLNKDFRNYLVDFLTKLGFTRERLNEFSERLKLKLK